ncbi:hypothetical protein [Roseivirga pacifica]|uniref:hypothetical protein n=1 Tax=Roseivirga pacifica TaxID=1267423 RepID=UPI00227BCDFB|nr:hypothetical protein [Roseivirga pacifica]
MTKAVLIGILLFTCGAVSAQKLDRKAQIETMYRLIDEYSPTISYMIKTSASLPRNYRIAGMRVSAGRHQPPETWLSGNTESKLVDNLSMVAHESAHGFQFIYPFNVLQASSPEDFKLGDYTAYFLDSARTYVVKHTVCFNSNELKNEIPKDLRTYRYTPYIAPKSGIGSQKEGFYGLLGEFNAYYIGMLMTHNMFAYYETQASEDLEAYQKYIQNISSDVAAFYEFKYFLLQYLLKSKLDYPDQYELLIDNTALRIAYTQVYTAFENLVKTYDKQLLALETKISNLGIPVNIDDEYFWVDGYGVGLNLQTINPMKTELAKPVYEEVHQAFIYQN